MSTTFYLPRKLRDNANLYTEEELLASSNYVVVLAEPGGGKTELMGSLARQLGTEVVTASKFAHVRVKAFNTPLVIDAFDELSKVDNSGINKLLGKAEEANPTHVYLSSRSSEWDNAATCAFQDFFGHSPLVVRLCEFTVSEQTKIFDHHLPGEDFTAFQTEVTRFNLEALLPNPQFLILFADAFIESGRHFIDKRSIFAQAVERLAKEANPSVASIESPLSTVRKVDITSEVFSKLLLAGAEGICTMEATENRMYPLLASLLDSDTGTNCILATRLFKPSDSVDQHRPVHKIVAEYCSAKYLTKRITDPADPLTLPKCLPIIAPNSTVRDDLRGLLGWMAALGNKPIQESVIELDPYAVLANGDPSQLENSSKSLLISRLKRNELQDPYFRRGDFWRRFSVAGFFTQDVIDEIKPLLTSGSDGHLRDLFLELLRDSPAIEHLRDELSQLILTPTESEHTRRLATRCLLDIGRSNYRFDLNVLISEASNASLSIAAEIIESVGPETLERAYLAQFLRVCSTLYPSHRERQMTAIGDRYFLKMFINRLDLSTIEWLLDDLTKDIACICGKESYACDCRNGISKIVGSMLDRYFESATPPFNPLRIWRWVGNLNFHEQKGTDQSKAVQMLHNDRALRQGIISHVFRNLVALDEIRKTWLEKFDFHSHSGLNFRADDYRYIVDLAFETNNLQLWINFMPSHRFYHAADQQGPHELRRHMREHALEKPHFMREWVKKNRIAKQQFERDNYLRAERFSKRKRRHRRKQAKIRRANIEFIQDNRRLIECGRNWNCLVHFAQLTLMSPGDIESRVGDEELVRCALRNCLDFIAPKVPDLLGLAELACDQKRLQSEDILYASCLEIMSFKGNLEGIDLRLLKALRTNCSVAYNAVSNEQLRALVTEVDRLIFADGISAERFLRQYLEPQLAQPGCNCHKLELLSEDVFSHLRASLSIEWLKRFLGLSLSSLDRLFQIAVQYGNRDDLKKVILSHCEAFVSDWPYLTECKDIEQKRSFWFIRAYCFLGDVPEACWSWLQIDKDTLLLLSDFYGQLTCGRYAYWPKLGSSKVEDILNAFIGRWPKVALPASWDNDSPKEERAYRFLSEVIWSTDSGEPDDVIPILERLLADSHFDDLHNIIKTIHASQVRKKALRSFEPPSPRDIVNLLDHGAVVTVEGLRQLVVQELQRFQNNIHGGEFNSANRFYENGKRLGEVRSTEIIAERLNLRLEPQGISVNVEHQLKDANRSDFTASKMITGMRRLLVAEVKGQWHEKLYTAAAAQLHERYSIHPDAEQQGIYIAIWFGSGEKVAGLKRHSIASAQELKISIEERMPEELRGLIDVFVLDVSKSK
jgi:hypothetical protein